MMTISSYMSDLDHAAVVLDFEQLVARVAPQHLALALRTLARVQPERWQMEWYLPRWLGEPFGLDMTLTRALVLSNSLGLASIRLQDDLADGETAENERDAIAELAHVLYHAALDVYQPHFPPSDSFWKRVDAYMGSWRAATATVNQPGFSDLGRLKNLGDPSTQCIAALGAPLKICADAICSLTAHPFAPALHALLDHAMIAVVLYDHVIDCDADLRAGRWNLFAAVISNGMQSPDRFHEQRARINAAWAATGKPRAYFEQITFHLDRAQKLNRQFSMQGLDDYMAELRRTIWRTHDSLASAYRADLARAAETIFGPLVAFKLEPSERRRHTL